MITDYSYRGNARLKRPGAQIEWTPEMIEEYIRCKEDPIYFAEKHIKVVTSKGFVPIILRDYQKEFILSMKNNRFTYALQARQSGKCCDGTTKIKIRNKKTNEIQEITMEELFNKAKTND